MSFRSGTFSSSSVSDVSKLAHSMGRAAFLAPDTGISPCRRRPPVISSLSILGGLEFVGGQSLHGQGMDFSAHAVTQRSVDDLMACHASLSLEFRADDQ